MKTLPEMIAVMQAAADGKEIEWREHKHTTTGDIWTYCNNLEWDWSTFDYRKKQDSYIPLTAADFPPGTYIRERNIPNEWRAINCISEFTFWAFPWLISQSFDSKTLMDNFEYTTDGKTWKPCYKL